MTAPRVLHVVLSLAPGGTEQLVVDLAVRLRHRFPMAVCCLDDAGAWASDLQQAGITVDVLGRRPGFRPMLGRRLAETAARHHATVLHCHHYSPFIYGAMSRVWHPARVLFTEHGRLVHQRVSRKRRLANAVFGRAAGGVFTVSQDLKRHVVAEGFAANHVRVIYNGIEPGPVPDVQAPQTARALIGAGAGELLIGVVGRLDPVKDLPTVIRAFRAVATEFPRARLVVVGDGPERAALERVLAAEQLQDRVTLSGYRRDVRSILPAFDVYVNCSKFEGISLGILEAMAARLPVVATAVGGTPEVIDASTGILVPPEDPAAIAAALRMMLRDQPMRTSLGCAARNRVERVFSIQRMVDDYASVYGEEEVSACVG